MIYILLSWANWEGELIHGVFGTEQAARDYADKENHKLNSDSYGGTEIRVYKINSDDYESIEK